MKTDPEKRQTRSCEQIPCFDRLKNIAMESAFGPIIFGDPQGYTTYVNEAFLQVWGYKKKEEVIGRHGREFWAHPDEIDELFCQLRQKGRWEGIKEAVRSDGETLQLKIRGETICDEKGKALHMVGTFADITEFSKVSKQFERERNLYQALLNNVPDAIFAKDRESKFVLCNKPLIKMGKFVPSAEVIGKTDFDFMPKSVAKKFFEQEQEIFRTGKPIIDALCQGDIDKKFWYISSKIPIRNSKGQIEYLLGFQRDVSDFKKTKDDLGKAQAQLENRVRERTAELERANLDLVREIEKHCRTEQALKVAEERFRAIFENSLIGMYRIDQNGNLIMANPALAAMLGYSSFKELAEANQRGELYLISCKDDYKELFDLKGSVVGLESVWKKPEGSEIVLREGAVRIIQDNGKCYYEGTVEDITERKVVEYKLLQYQQQLRRLASDLSLSEEKMRRKMAVEIHDNISQNLAISKLKINSLLTQDETGQLSDELLKVRELIGQSLDRSRTLTFELSPPVLYELGFEAAVKWLLNQSRTRDGLDYDFICGCELDYLSGNLLVLLFQAVRELLVNVAKYAQASRVVVEIKIENEVLEITISDDGNGFDPKKLNRQENQSGFGLFSIKERLSIFKGKMLVNSRYGFGTEVKISLPKHESD